MGTELVTGLASGSDYDPLDDAASWWGGQKNRSRPTMPPDPATVRRQLAWRRAITSRLPCRCTNSVAGA